MDLAVCALSRLYTAVLDLCSPSPNVLFKAGLDLPPSPPRAADFFNFLASMGNLPEVTIPIGQVKYFSHVSNEYEMIPVAVQLVARSGCDRVLLEIVKKLGESGALRDVQVGRTAF